MAQGVRRGVRVGLLSAVFAVGYLLGALSQQPAEAQVGEILKQAEGQGGVIGGAAKLGTTIGDMQTHVSELQKNIDTLNQIKTSLGGG